MTISVWNIIKINNVSKGSECSTIIHEFKMYCQKRYFRAMNKVEHMQIKRHLQFLGPFLHSKTQQGGGVNSLIQDQTTREFRNRNKVGMARSKITAQCAPERHGENRVEMHGSSSAHVECRHCASVCEDAYSDFKARKR